MELITIIYLADIVKSLSFTCALFGLLFLISIPVYIIGALDTYKEFNKMIAILLTFLSFLSISTAIFLPSKETIYLMAATKYSQEALKDPKVTEVMNKVYKVINLKLDSMIPKEGK